MHKTNFLFQALAAGSIFLLPEGEAATLHVDGNVGSDAGNCLDNSNPCLTVSRAVNVAQAGDTIQIADAIYTEILSIDKALTLTGQSRNGTIIQSAADRLQASDRVISVADDVNLTLSDLTIRHGNSQARGGGLRSVGGNLVIERVTFTRNDAEAVGGGLFSGDNAVVMNDVVFRENASDREGGGASLGVNSLLTTVTLDNVVFDGNMAVVSGGGLDLFNCQSMLSNVALNSNTTDGPGGGLSYRGRNSVDSSLEMRDVAFIGNSAVGSGGGIYTEFDTPYTMINVLFSGNRANLGGGLYNQGSTNGDRIMTNVTMSGNDAELRGGAIDRPKGTTFRNTIIWNNRDSSGAGTADATMDDFSSSDIIEVSNSLLQGYPANEFPGSDNLDGTDPDNNPDFVTPVSPVGAPSLSGNLRLREGSPVIDAGNNSFLNGVSVDLDGFSRINGSAVDLGPYEHGNDTLFQDRFEG